MSTMRVYTREFRESAVGLVLSPCCLSVASWSVDPRSGRGPRHALPHAAQLGPRPAARAAIFEWIDVWHQRIRIYGSLSYVSPKAFKTTERVG